MADGRRVFRGMVFPNTVKVLMERYDPDNNGENPRRAVKKNPAEGKAPPPAAKREKKQKERKSYLQPGEHC